MPLPGILRSVVAQSTMGTTASRTTKEEEEDNSVKPVRRQIGKRSSVTLLGRLDSRSTSARTPYEQSSDLSVENPDPPSAPVYVPRYSRQFSSNSATTVASKPVTIFHHKPTLYAESTTSTIGPSKIDGVDEVDKRIDEESESEQDFRMPNDLDDSRAETPRAIIPKPSFAPLLPVPPVLGSESPSNYGFDDVMRTARDSAMQSKRRTISGPELFEVNHPRVILLVAPITD